MASPDLAAPPPVNAPSTNGAVAIPQPAATRLAAPAWRRAPLPAADAPLLSALSLGAPPPLFIASGRGGPPLAVAETGEPHIPATAARPAAPAAALDAPAETGHLEVPPPPALVFPSGTTPAGAAAASPPPAPPAASSSSPRSAASTGGQRSQSVLRPGSSGPQVERLQTLLNRAGARPQLKPDGDFGPATERALRDFQAAHGLKPDGIAGSASWRALDGAMDSPVVHPTPSRPADPSPAQHPQTGNAGSWCFPLAFIPSPNWKTGARYFGARRDGGKRMHAGCDLLGPKGSTIYAVADGTLVRPAYSFYSGTDAVEIRHGPYIVRYGEIMPGSYKGGATVRKGEPICKIGRLNSGSSMLHFEMYSNGASSAPLTVHQGPYRRRADLMNPTQLLDEWARSLPR